MHVGGKEGAFVFILVAPDGEVSFLVGGEGFLGFFSEIF